MRRDAAVIGCPTCSQPISSLSLTTIRTFTGLDWILALQNWVLGSETGSWSCLNWVLCDKSLLSTLCVTNNWVPGARWLCDGIRRVVKNLRAGLGWISALQNWVLGSQTGSWSYLNWVLSGKSLLSTIWMTNNWVPGAG